MEKILSYIKENLREELITTNEAARKMSTGIKDSKVADSPKLIYPMSQERQDFICGCSIPKPKEKQDCYFYHEEYDMGAHIPTCSYHAKLGHCPCGDCNKHIKKAEVFGMIKNHVDRETGILGGKP